MFIVLLQLSKRYNPDYPSMAKGLRDLGHKVYFGFLDEGGYLVWDKDEQPPNQLSVRTQPEVGCQDQSIAGNFHKQLANLLLELNPDVVQFNDSFLKYAWKLKRELPSTMLFIQDVKQINLQVNEGVRSKIADRRKVSSINMNARFVCDHTLFDYHYAAAAVLGENWQHWSTVVPVGVRPELLELPRPPRPYADETGQVRFVYVGALTRLRELEILFGGIRALLENTEGFQVDFIGPDKSEGYYHDLVEAWGMSERVRLLPVVPHSMIPETLNAGYDVGLAYNPIRPTWHFQPTIKVLEYRALGMPIISSDVLSHRDYVEEGVNGMLIPNTEDAWAAAILRFVHDRSFLDECYQQALRMRKANTILDVARMHEEVYQRLLNSRA